MPIDVPVMQRLSATLPNSPNLTVGKGIHLTVPIEPSLTYDERAIMRMLSASASPGQTPRYTLASATNAARQNLIDYLHNSRGNTSIGPLLAARAPA
jgi:DNA primase